MNHFISNHKNMVRFSKNSKPVAKTPVRGRKPAAAPVAQPTRGRQTAQPARTSKPVRENRLAFIGNAWFNLRKDSRLTDAQVEKAYSFIDTILLPNFYQKLTIDQDFGADGVTLVSGDNIKLWQNNKRAEINPRTGEQYQDADMRVSVALDGADDGFAPQDVQAADFDI